MSYSFEIFKKLKFDMWIQMMAKAVRRKGAMSLRNGIWHDLRPWHNYAKYDTCGMTKTNKLTAERALFSRQFYILYVEGSKLNI